MLALRLVVLASVAVLVADRASAQSSTKTGTIPQNTSGTAMGGVFHDSGWNTGGFYCRVGSLIVWPASGPCLRRQAIITFQVLTGGGVTSTDHSYTYHVFCGAGNIVRHEIEFDGASLTPIDTGTFTFNLTGGDTIRLITTEGPIPTVAPSLQPRGYVVLLLVLLATGALLLRRRRVAGT